MDGWNCIGSGVALGIATMLFTIFTAAGALMLTLVYLWRPPHYKPFRLLWLLLFAAGIFLFVLGAGALMHMALTQHTPDSLGCASETSASAYLESAGKFFLQIFVPGVLIQYVIRFLYRRYRKQ